MNIALCAFSLTALWSQWVWPLLLFVIGLGLVVFVHELGHFLVAKFVGIRVDRFALGFGPRLLGFRRGETEYCLCALPLGGYIAMAGQEDFKPDTDVSPDPRSFKNKSVGARFAVVAAGVVMNVIFAAILFLIVSLIGVPLSAPVVGGVLPGFPADQAKIAWEGAPASQPATQSAPASSAAEDVGLKPGDRILRVDSDSFVLNLVGRNVTHFEDVGTVSMLAKRNERFTLTIEREVGGRARVGRTELEAKPLPDGSRLSFGIVPAADIVFGRDQDIVSASPFQDGDRLVSVAGRKIEHSWDIDDIEKTLTGKPVIVVVDRDGKQVEVTLRPLLTSKGDVLWLADGSRLKVVRADLDADKHELTAVLPDGSARRLSEKEVAGGLYGQLDVLGMSPRIRAGSVIAGSRADKAGLKPGDVVLGYADQENPTVKQVYEINERVEDSGANMVLLRGEETKKLWVVPKSREDRAQIGMLMSSDLAHAIVAGVREGSPAAKAGVPAGADILAVGGQPVTGWIELYDALKARAGGDVTLTYRLGAQENTVDLGVLTPAVFDPQEYDYSLPDAATSLRPLTVTISESNPLKALGWGCRETCKFVLTTYISLRSLFMGTVPLKALHGPVGIGGLAVQVGRKSVIHLVYLMAFLSAVIAVMNFLPIPVMDGGLAVLLLIEKIRRKPLPTKVMVGIQIFGWVLLLSLFVALTWNDIARLVAQMW